MSFLEIASQMIDKLPQIMQFVQILSAVVMIWFFGNIAVRSVQKKLHFGVRYLLSVAVGFLIYFCATAMNNVIILISGDIFDLLKLNLIINSIIATVIISVALYLLTFDRKEESPKKIIDDLKKKIEEMKIRMAEKKVMMVSREDAEKKALEHVDCYSVKSVTMRDGRWDVSMEDTDKRKADFFIDPYDGSFEIVKDESHIKIKAKSLIGAILLIGILIFSLFNFTGFVKDDFSDIAKGLGIPEEEAEMIFSQKDMEEGCISAMSITAKHGMSLGELDEYESEHTKKIIEESAEQKVIRMYTAPYEGTDYILAIVLPADVNMTDSREIESSTNICVATEDKLCDCLR